MELIESEKHFLTYVAHTTNYRQLKACIYEMNEIQKHLIREMSINILENIIETDSLFLNSNKFILSDIADNKLSWTELEKNSNLIADIVRFSLRYYGICQYYEEKNPV